MIRSRRFLLALCAILALCAVAPVAHALEFGMGDQKPRMFADPRFQALGIERVRIVVDWDVALVAGPELARLDAWLEAARAHGKEPLIAFTDARARPRYLPSADEYEHAFAALQARHPWVRLYTTWNEGNLSSQPTADMPERVARFYDVLRTRCGECTVIAADVLDQGGMVRWVQRVRAAVTLGEPRVTGVHNYVEVNRPERTGSTAALLAAVPGAVWLTETGGIVKHASAEGRINWAYDEQRAARATAHAIGIARSDPRIERIYLYQWSVDAYERWDSAFIGPTGEARPALDVLRAALGTAPRRSFASLRSFGSSAASRTLRRKAASRSRAARRRCSARVARLPSAKRRARARVRCRAHHAYPGRSRAPRRDSSGGVLPTAGR